jgi:hypothetical protein
MASVAVERPLDRAAGVNRAGKRGALLLIVAALLDALWEGYRALGIHFGWTHPFPVDATTMPHIHDMFRALFVHPNTQEPLLIVTLLKAALFTAREAALGFAMGATGGCSLSQTDSRTSQYYRYETDSARTPGRPDRPDARRLRRQGRRRLLAPPPFLRIVQAVGAAWAAASFAKKGRST